MNKNNMKDIKFVDLNKVLVRKVSELGIDSVYGDYFREAYQTPFSVLMTASNPSFTFGGGLDYHFTNHFPELCRFKKVRGGGNERISNVCFVVTVNDDFVATKETIKAAIDFSLKSLLPGETLILSGVGTGIGRLSVESFVEVIKSIKY